MEAKHETECTQLYRQVYCEHTATQYRSLTCPNGQISDLKSEVAGWEKQHETFVLIDGNELFGLRQQVRAHERRQKEREEEKAALEDDKKKFLARQASFETTVDTLKNERRVKVLEASQQYQLEMNNQMKDKSEGSKTAKQALKLACKCGGSIYLDLVLYKWMELRMRGRCQSAISRWWTMKNKQKLIPQVTKLLDRAVHDHRRMIKSLKSKEAELCAMRLEVADAKSFHPEITKIDEYKDTIRKREQDVEKLNLRIAQLSHRMTEAQRNRLAADQALEEEIHNSEDRVNKQLTIYVNEKNIAMQEKNLAQAQRADMEVTEC